MSSRRRRLAGRVVSDKMDKTIVVVVERSKRHPLYGKVIKIRKRYMAHDADNACRAGDLVTIVESRPLSKHKRWAVEAILERAAFLAGLETGQERATTGEQP